MVLPELVLECLLVERGHHFNPKSRPHRRRVTNLYLWGQMLAQSKVLVGQLTSANLSVRDVSEKKRMRREK